VSEKSDDANPVTALSSCIWQRAGAPNVPMLPAQGTRASGGGRCILLRTSSAGRKKLFAGEAFDDDGRDISDFVIAVQ
jgi:hypothetical protein